MLTPRSVPTNPGMLTLGMMAGDVVGAVSGFSPSVFRVSNYGVTRFLDVNVGVGGNGLAVETPYKSLTVALAAMQKWDTLLVAPGDYTNGTAATYETPLNAVAPMCRMIGLNPHGRGFGPWFGQAAAGLPILNIRARNWRISGFEFDNPSSEAGLRITTLGTSDARFTQVDNCLFTGGKFGIDLYGAGTYAMIYNNVFDLIQVANGSAMTCGSVAGVDTPRRNQIIGNEFAENVNHLNFNTAGRTSRGLKSSKIFGNTFQGVGFQSGGNVTMIFDFTGGGGNQFCNNYLGITKTEWANGTYTTAGTNDGVNSVGNHMNDGEQAAVSG